MSELVTTQSELLDRLYNRSLDKIQEHGFINGVKLCVEDRDEVIVSIEGEVEVENHSVIFDDGEITLDYIRGWEFEDNELFLFLGKLN
jgi:hypothetical protein